MRKMTWLDIALVALGSFGYALVAQAPLSAAIVGFLFGLLTVRLLIWLGVYGE